MLARVTAVDEIVPADLHDRGGGRGLGRSSRTSSAAPTRRFRPAAILASNTSSIPITSLAAVTERPDRVIGMHFFNPVPVLKLVEVVRGRETSDETAAAIVALAEELGKTPAVANDFPGFVSNRILMPFINEAVWALHDGVAEPEAIDTIAKLGFAHPMGPLALADLIGLDTCVAIMEVLAGGPRRRASTRRARCCASTSRPAASGASRARVSTLTADGLRALGRAEGDPGAHARLRRAPRSSRTRPSGIASTTSRATSSASSPSSA